MATDYLSMRRTELAEYAENQDRDLERANKRATQAQKSNLKNSELKENLLGTVLTGPSSAGLTGYLETRVPNRDGSRLSLGPVPLPVVVGALSSLGAYYFKGARTQLMHVTSAQLGLAMGTLGRAYGTMHRLKKASQPAARGPVAVEGYQEDPGSLDSIGDEAEWTEEERFLMGEG